MSYYVIPKNITEEETFMYTLVEKLHWAGMSYGSTMGCFYSIIEKMKEKNVSDDIIKDIEMIYESVDKLLGEYNKDIFNYANERWEKLGKPLSLAAHQERKKHLEEEERKAEYYEW